MVMYSVRANDFILLVELNNMLTYLGTLRIFDVVKRLWLQFWCLFAFAGSVAGRPSEQSFLEEATSFAKCQKIFRFKKNLETCCLSRCNLSELKLLERKATWEMIGSLNLHCFLFSKYCIKYCGHEGSQIGSWRNYAMCVYGIYIIFNIICCSETSVHNVFLYWFSSMGVDYKAQKRSLLSSSSNFNARWSMNYRIVTHIAGDGSWNTYLLPVNYGWRIWSFWSTDYQVSFSKQLRLFLASCHKLLSHVFHSFPKNGTCCNRVCNYRWNWSDLADSTASLRRSKTKWNIICFQYSSNRLTETGHKSLILTPFFLEQPMLATLQIYLK